MAQPGRLWDVHFTTQDVLEQHDFLGISVGNPCAMWELMPFRDDWPCEERTDAWWRHLTTTTKSKRLLFISPRLDPPELNYDGNELECLAFYWALDKLWHYVSGRDGQLTAVTDNTAVVFLQKKAAVKNKFSRWVILISEHGATFKHRRGSSNVVAESPEIWLGLSVCISGQAISPPDCKIL